MRDGQQLDQNYVNKNKADFYRFFTEHDHEIRDVDFVVDISAVANLVQPETDKLLGKL